MRFLRVGLTRCRHCRIFFLTHPRNAGRRDLGCPFGCRDAHRRKKSTQRSVEYYRGAEGRFKKRIQNGKRGAAERTAGVQPDSHKDEDGWPVSLAEHVRMVVGLIEGRRVSRREVVEMLVKVLRQHRMGRRGKIDHLIAWLNEHSP